ncbi:MAG: type I restriction-modification system endonuclease, partial [Thalassolituus sp.]
MKLAEQASNFAFLEEHDPLLVELAKAAERSFSSDPNTTLIKLRQLGEAMAQHLAAAVGVEFDDKTSQADLLYQLNRELRLDPNVREMFHILRIEGNKATHQFRTQHKEAIDGLRVARNLAVWFHQSFGKQGTAFKPGPFVAPSDPSADLRELQAQISKLSNELEQANQELTESQQLNDLIVREKAEYEELLDVMDEESKATAEQTVAIEAALAAQEKEYEAKLTALREQIKEQDSQAQSKQRQQVSSKTQAATQHIVLDEELTRILIDTQLIEAGWEADSTDLTYQRGVRPEKGKNLAIAEWPTEHLGQKGRADYVLFAGLTPIAVVEAKKENTNVAGKITQAERYSKGFQVSAPLVPAWELAGQTIAWPDEGENHYKIPFVYSCNGRPYVPQLAEQSGTWFRDVRGHANTKRALQKFHTPEGLLDLLQRSKEEAQKKLESEPFGYLKLRDYQQKAINAVEQVLTRDERSALLAMATGTGKTRTIIG